MSVCSGRFLQIIEIDIPLHRHLKPAALLPPPPSHHLHEGSEMIILIIKYCKDSLSTAGMKTSQARRGGHRQTGSLKHVIQRSAHSPSLLRPLNSPLKEGGGPPSLCNSQPRLCPPIVPLPNSSFCSRSLRQGLH